MTEQCGNLTAYPVANGVQAKSPHAYIGVRTAQTITAQALAREYRCRSLPSSVLANHALTRAHAQEQAMSAFPLSRSPQICSTSRGYSTAQWHKFFIYSGLRQTLCTSGACETMRASSASSRPRPRMCEWAPYCKVGFRRIVEPSGVKKIP